MDTINKEVSLARPEWNHEEYFREKYKDVTIMICQRKTRDLIQLCLTSILNHYPEIKVLVVDGHSEDDSVEWLRFISAKYPNVKLWERPEGRNSHGETMHEAMGMIETKYVLLMDSDTIVRRHGFIEGMLGQFSHNQIDDSSRLLYATGSLMLQSIKGEACSQPIDDKDVLHYAHPSCSMYDMAIYWRLQSPFTDHGAPCALNNIEAQKRGYLVEYFPVDKFVQHLCGASWQEIPTVWNDDGDVLIRPLVTFILMPDDNLSALSEQTDTDFNCVMIGDRVSKKISTYDRGGLAVDSLRYDIRFNVDGHYVCAYYSGISNDFVKEVRAIALAALSENRNEYVIQGMNIYERKHWQKNYSVK